jgi:hypothetical protein
VSKIVNPTSRYTIAFTTCSLTNIIGEMIKQNIYFVNLIS